MSPLRPWLAANIACLASVCAASAHAETVTAIVVGPDGKPVAGATVYVSVYSATSGQTTKTLISDASGAFTLDASPYPDQKEKNPLVARVCVAAPGFGLAQTFLTLYPSDSNTIRLEKGATLRGKVVDAAGKPLVGAAVRLQGVYLGGPRGNGGSYLWLSEDLRQLPGLTAKTDVNGAWTLSSLPASAVHASVIMADPKYVQVSNEIPLSGTSDKPIVARLGASLTGKVVGKDGTPRSGVGVFARLENFREGSASAVTGADGSYRLTGLPTGVVAVWVDQRRGTPGITRKIPEEVAAPLRQVSVTEGKEASAPDIVLQTGGVVEGMVTDAVDGKPVPGAQISGAGISRRLRGE